MIYYAVHLLTRNHKDGRNLFERAKKIRKDFRDTQTKKFSKMFTSS